MLNQRLIAAALTGAMLALGGCALTSSTQGPNAVRAHTRHASPRPHTTTAKATPSASPSHTVHHRHHHQHPKHHHPARAALRAKGPVSKGWLISYVTDGDTVHVTKGGRELTIRLIGINTPETVDPFTPVECFGPQASAYAKRVLFDRHAALEWDRSQGRLDRYGRTLAYLWVNGPHGWWLYEQRAIRLGYGKEYTYDTLYNWHAAFVQAQTSAINHHRGLWSRRTCNGNTTQPAR